MPCAEKTVTIDGHVYHMRQLGALQGRKLWLKLIKVLAAPVSQLREAESGATTEVVTKALASLVENLDDETAEELYAAFGANCTVKNGERQPTLEGVVFDDHFAGEYVRMSKWLGQCIVFNFASFLGDGALGKIGALAQAAGSRLKSQTDSIGSSGGSSVTSAPQ